MKHAYANFKIRLSKPIRIDVKTRSGVTFSLLKNIPSRAIVNLLELEVPMTYHAPVNAMQFLLRHGVDLDKIVAMPKFEDATDELIGDVSVSYTHLTLPTKA